MTKRKFLALILLVVMVLTIGKYQLPHIEYFLFKGYIAKNLCVKKNERGNCCQGKCFLEKQIRLVDDQEAASKNANTAKKIRMITELSDYIETDKPDVTLYQRLYRLFTYYQKIKICEPTFRIFVPPRKIA